MPLMKGLKQFHELFLFRGDIGVQRSKFVCLHSQRLREFTVLALGNTIFHEGPK